MRIVCDRHRIDLYFRRLLMKRNWHRRSNSPWIFNSSSHCIFASKASNSLSLVFNLAWYHYHQTVGKSYCPFLKATNHSYSVYKIMSVYKIPNILNSMMFFKKEFTVDHFKYNWDTPVLLFSCLLSAIWLDTLESQGS